MNVFVSENPTVRIYKERSTGKVIGAVNNIHGTLKVEVVEIPDGVAIVTAEERIPNSYPFGALVQLVPVPVK